MNILGGTVTGKNKQGFTAVPFCSDASFSPLRMHFVYTRQKVGAGSMTHSVGILTELYSALLALPTHKADGS